MNTRPVLDFGWALAILLLLGVAWTAAEPAPGADAAERDLDGRVQSLIDRYDDGQRPALAAPAVVVENWDGPGVATANCDLWRIRVRADALGSLSDPALDELLAHEVAHLVSCAENGFRTAHDVEWWRVYRRLQTG